MGMVRRLEDRDKIEKKVQPRWKGFFTANCIDSTGRSRRAGPRKLSFWVCLEEMVFLGFWNGGGYRLTVGS